MNPTVAEVNSNFVTGVQLLAGFQNFHVSF